MLINKKIIIVNFLIFIFLFVNINGQTSTTMWEKDLHNSGYESFNSVIQTSDSCFVCVGEVNPFGGDSYSDLWIVKLNPSGDTIWSKTIESLGITEILTDVIKMKRFNGDLLMVGKTNNNALVMRTDENGNIKWKQNYATLYISSSAFSVIQTQDNNFIVGGSVFLERNDELDWDLLLLSINSRGELNWSKTYDLGNNFTEALYSVIETSDNSLIVVGSENFPFEPPWTEVFILKLDKEGNQLWHKLYGTDGYDYASDVKELKNGDLIISGKYNPLNKDADFWLLKTNKYGDTLWTKKYGGEASERASSLAVTNDGGFVITGNTESYTNGFIDLWVVRTDSLGKTLWSKNYGGRYLDGGRSIIKTYGGGYVAAGIHVSDEPTEDSSHYQTDNGYVIRITENVVDVADEEITFKYPGYRLYQNYPNPFNPSTTIKFSIPRATNLNLSIFNIIGEKVGELVDGRLDAGIHAIKFNASNLNSGVYIYKIESEKFQEVRKMLILK